MSFQDTLVDVIDTNLTKKPNSPQFKFTNPLKKKIYVNSIQLSFDGYFSEKGAILIKINNNTILNKIAGSLKSLQNLTLPMQNQEFLQQQKIEIFAWNGIDTDMVSVGYDIQISEDPNSPPSSDTPLSQIQRNSQISQPDNIFAQKNYSNETQTALIDMKGYKKLILIVGGSDESTPTVLIGTQSIADNDLNTSMNFGTPNVKTVKASVDFGNVASRLPSAKVGFTQSVDDKAQYFLEVSDDNVNWVEVASSILSATGTTTLTGLQQLFRFLRVQVLSVVVGDPSADTSQIYELFDANATGGTAKISFDILLNDSTWVELISATSLGTITSGGSLTKTIGDVINDLSTNKFNFALPSTQTKFRLKMVVVGNLNIGVSMMRIQ